VTRAAVIANASTGFREAGRLLEGCELIDVDREILDRAKGLGDRSLPALDAIHLASALLVEADQLLAYDRRLVDAAERAGLQTASPGR
jgi:predicted nucleic acid-binding protein